MQQIKLKRGLDIPFEGPAVAALGSVCRPEVFRIVPDHFVGITPKLLVKEGDVVKAGTPLFYDKLFDQMLFTSPVSGVVKAIIRGERRKIMSIDIQADAQIKYEEFSTQYAGGEEVKSLLLKSGLWALIKQRPYDCIAMPSKAPRAIFISSFDTAPVAPDYAYVLKGQLPTLQAAITALSQMAPVYVGLQAGCKTPEFRELKDCTLYEVSGAHPAGNVGVQINHVCPMAKGDTIFCINIQDVALIGRFFQKGIVDMQKKVALTGPLAYGRQYYNVLPGMPVSAILRSNVQVGVSARIVAGNVLSGHQVSMDETISIYDNQFTVLAEGDDKHEFMGWLIPRFSAFNAGKTDPAVLLDNCVTRWLFGPKQYQWDARMKGGRRAIIVSGEYDKVFPMDIYPEYLIKAIITGNIDKMEQLGIYEVAPEDFALCEFVDSSKLELQRIVREGLDKLRAEMC